jgi:hypothetical protein
MEKKKFNIGSILITAFSAILLGGIIVAVVGQGIFASRVSTAELVAETKAEFEHQLEVINTGQPNKPFPYSKYAEDWARHSVDISKVDIYEKKRVAKNKITPVEVEIRSASRTDFFAEPRVRATIVYSYLDCLNWRKSDQKCLEWDPIRGSQSDYFDISFWEVDGKWRIKDFIVHDGIRFPAAGDVLNWRCWSIKTGFDNCPALYND